MLPMEWNVSTVVVALIVAALAVLAVRRLLSRGMCDCNDHCDCSSSGGCSGCAAADKMVADMERAAKADARKRRD